MRVGLLTLRAMTNQNWRDSPAETRPGCWSPCPCNRIQVLHGPSKSLVEPRSLVRALASLLDQHLTITSEHFHYNKPLPKVDRILGRSASNRIKPHACGKDRLSPLRSTQNGPKADATTALARAASAQPKQRRDEPVFGRHVFSPG